MNSRQMQYAIALSKFRNFSETAEKLNISQPALSKQIMNLEKELGVKLFDRDRTPLELTPAGAFFVQEAQSILYREDQLLRTVEQFRAGTLGRLVIGTSQFRGLYMLPDILRKVAEKYPGVQVSLHEADSERRKENMAEGKYDFAIINLPVDEAVFDVIPLEPDTLVLAVPNTMLHRLSKIPQGHLAQIDMADCGNLPFVTVAQTQELRKLFDQLCTKAGISPPIAIEVFSVTTAWSMTRAGLGAAVLPLQFVNENAFSDNLTLFAIKDNTFIRQPAVITRRGQYLSDYAKYAIGLLTNSKNVQ